MNFADLPNQIKVMIGALLVVALLAVGANFIPRGGGDKVGADGAVVAPGQVLIYSNMEPKVAAEAAAELKEKNIPFQIVREGTALSVPADKADEARIKLAVKGLPKEGDIGFSQLFGDKPNSFISTDFEKKVAYNRALMGELGRVIKKIDGVETAAVLINTPEEQLFAEERKPVTASVMVKQMPNRVLSKEQVEGIQHLVASSVPGLKTNNVTVVSDTGKLMSDGMADNAGDIEDQLLTKALDRQMMLTRERETAIETKVQSLLDKLFGPGKSVVRVACELDFTQRKTMTDAYNAPTDAQGNRIVNNKERVEERGGSSGNSGGVPGVNSNVPQYPLQGGTDAMGGNQYSKIRENESTTNLSRQRQLTEEEVGTLKRMSITALIQGLPAERVVSMTEIVTAAAGADIARRGDQVVVRPVAFDTSQTDMLKELIAQEAAAKNPDANAKKKSEGPVTLPWIIGTAAAVIVILAFLLIMRMASRKEDTTDVLVNSLGDPGLPPNFDPNALGGYQNQYEMTGQVPMANDGPFGFLEQVEPEHVADLLAQERPGNAAAVLSQLNPDYANMVLSVMPEDLQVDLLNRLDDNQPALPPFQQKTIATQLKRRLGVPV